MTHLIPPTIPADEPSEGERLVFERFSADRGHPDWTVFHSLDIANHRRRLEGEIDFLCVVPGKGVLVLEVKGCHVLRRSDGLWFYGHDHQGDARGPFKQASEGMHSIRARLVKHHSELAHVVFWSAVCFPFIDFHEPSEEWHSWQVIDRRALQARSIGDLCAAVLDQARKLLVDKQIPWFPPADHAPTQQQCDAIVHALRPDFEFFESPKSRVRRLDEEIKHFTEEQFEALDQIDANPRIVFDGPAGTGKTLLAIEAARRAAAAGRRVLLLCFNRPLGSWLRDQTADLKPRAGSGVDLGSGPGVITRTIHEHMRVLAGIAPTPAQVCSQTFWQEELPELAGEALLERIERAEKGGGSPAGGDDHATGSGGSTAAAGRCPDVFDEIVLDEAQDVMRQSYLDFLDLSLDGGLSRGRWRFFGDFEYQRIYDASAIGVDEFLDELAKPDGRFAGAVAHSGAEHGGPGAEHGGPPGSAFRWDLRVNCRNTPRVAALACDCGSVAPGYKRVLRPDDDVEPEIRFWRDAAQQQKLLVECLEELAAAAYGGPRTAVLSPAGDERCTAAQIDDPPWRDRLEPLVKEARMEVGGGATVAEGDWPAACIPSDLDAVDLHSGKTKYCSIYRFKGLEAPAVIITDIERLDTPADCSLLYVGCTRALHRLVILAHKSLRGRFKLAT